MTRLSDRLAALGQKADISECNIECPLLAYTGHSIAGRRSAILVPLNDRLSKVDLALREFFAARIAGR